MRRSWMSTRLARTCATPMAMPGDAPTPTSRSIRAAPSRIDPFAETTGDEIGERSHGDLSVVPLTHHLHRHPVRGHQGQEAHDALAVGLGPVLDDLDLALEAIGALHEANRGAGMHAQPVSHLYVPFGPRHRLVTLFPRLRDLACQLGAEPDRSFADFFDDLRDLDWTLSAAID